MAHDQQSKWKGKQRWWRTFACAGNQKSCKEGEKSTSNEKTPRANFLFRAIAEFLDRKRTGRGEGIPQGQAQAGKKLTGAVDADWH